MGAVYLAQMEALGGKKVAVKEMELEGLSQKELAQAVKQFKKEASFLAHLDHPNLVPVTDFFVEGEKHYLVMAYVEGETLQQRLMRHGRPFDWEQVREWALALTEVLAYLHAQNPPILFRDLKPSNIMLEESGRLRLIDFGIARTAQTGDRTSTFLQGTGTSGFSPLEQYGGGQSNDQRSDIYALGATLYYLLTGTIPPDAVSRVSQGGKLIPPSQLRPGLSREIDCLLERALSVKQQNRHRDMEEFRRRMPGVDTASHKEHATEGYAGSSGPCKSIVVEMYPTASASLSSDKDSFIPWAVGLGSLLLVGIATLLITGKMSPAAASLPTELTPSPSLSVQAVTTVKIKPEKPSIAVPVEEVKRKSLGVSSGPARPKFEALSPPEPSPAPVSKRPSASLGEVSYPKAISSYPKAKTRPAAEKPAEAKEPLPSQVPPGFPEPPPGAPPPIIGPDGRPYPPPRRRPPLPQEDRRCLESR